MLKPSGYLEYAAEHIQQFLRSRGVTQVGLVVAEVVLLVEVEVGVLVEAVVGVLVEMVVMVVGVLLVLLLVLLVVEVPSVVMEFLQARLVPC